MAVTYPNRSPVRPLDAIHPGPAAPDGVKRGRKLGTLARIVLLAVLAWGVDYAVRHSQDAQADGIAAMAGQPGDAALADALLGMSELDASLLRSMPRRLDDACARNKYTLGQQACRARLQERGGACLTQVARAYPARSRTSNRTAPIVGAYLHCVFDA